jgi:DNA-binding transcriptional MerR regulator
VNIHELEELTGQPARNIRFLIAEGIVPEPNGKARWACYGPKHVEAIAFYEELKSQGITSIEAIRQRVQKRVEVGDELVLVPMPGVEIRIGAKVLQDVPKRELMKAIRESVEGATSRNKKEE